MAQQKTQTNFVFIIYCVPILTTDSVLIVFLINCIDYNGLYTSLTELLTGLASILFYYNNTKGSKRRQVYPGKRKDLFCNLLVNMGTYEVNFRSILLAICYSTSNSGFAWVAIWWYCFVLMITGQYFIFYCCLGIGWVGVAGGKFLAQCCLHLCPLGIPLWGWGSAGSAGSARSTRGCSSPVSWASSSVTKFCSFPLASDCCSSESTALLPVLLARL